MRSKIVISFIIILIIVGIICVFPLRYKVNTTLSGIHWINNDDSYSESVNITIEGTYFRYLIRDNIFTGNMKISEKNSATSYKILKLIILKKLDFSPVLVWQNDKFEDIGIISVDGVFDKVHINLMDKEHIRLSEENITAPASDRNSAIDVVSKFRQNR